MEARQCMAGQPWEGSVPEGKSLPCKSGMNCRSKTKAAVKIPACWGEKNMKHLQGKAAGIE